ncbi:MAG TPA: NrfD/PsrC family molybdoenzyme membrane anchor subunit [Gemmatimonadales bacterium]|nr:NrfD/PsrC family molybdoenzyme membrane anchor subunit [Gemmatimonadales bacterium]
MIPPPLASLLAQVGSPYVGHGFPPHWGWYIVLYFFCGGLAAGTYFIATLLLLVGDPRDREAVRLGYLLSFPLLLLCAVLLILDLGVPLRFWHMVVQSERIPVPMFKPWSPISLGTWILSIFGLFAAPAFLWALAEGGRLHWQPAVSLIRWAGLRSRPVMLAWNAAGTVFGLALAGYTGVLVTGTTIPVWQNARLMGALFLVSATSTSYALLMLLLLRRDAAGSAPTVAKLARADRFSMVLELVLIALLVVLLGRASRPLTTGGFGVLFWVGVVGVGVVAPLLLHRGIMRGWSVPRRELVAAACVLAGGLLLRFVVVMSPQYPAVSLWSL